MNKSRTLYKIVINLQICIFINIYKSICCFISGVKLHINLNPKMGYIRVCGDKIYKRD